MLVIINQIESTNDRKYSDNGTDIGIAIAWVMKSGNQGDAKCDEDGDTNSKIPETSDC